MADFPNKTCGERVYYSSKYRTIERSFICCKPAKFVCDVEMTDGVKRTKTQEYRCGIHAKRHKILEEYKYEKV